MQNYRDFNLTPIAKGFINRGYTSFAKSLEESGQLFTKQMNVLQRSFEKPKKAQIEPAVKNH